MRTLVVYSSCHHQNTQKVASVISQTLSSDLIRPQEAKDVSLDCYDLIGFGSGIFFGKHHKKLIEFINTAQLNGKDVFVFSTSGTGKPKNNDPLIELLTQKGAKVINSFACKGFDTYGPFKLIGGISKGHPNQKDLEQAKIFATSLK